MGRYQDALDYIFGYVNYEKQARYRYNTVTFDLSRMAQLLERLQSPHERFRSVLIAGTKGKGSTSAMVESVLRAAGHRIGLYTSPHLHTFRERIRVNGALLLKKELVSLLSSCRADIEATPGITAFEITTALALRHFAGQAVDLAVLEVGLGGRLDATNVIHPAVCAITSLSYDHVELLGHTLSLIALEKAGIIKPGVPVVSAPQQPEAIAVIRRVCAETGAPLRVVGAEWRWDLTGADRAGQSFSVRGPGGVHLADLRTPLLGRHQLDNATTAVGILSELSAQGLSIGDEALRAGLASVRWPGRFEILNEHPVLVVDSAHNRDSAAKLRAALAEHFPDGPDRRLILVFGASADKDIAGMISIFLGAESAPGYRPADRVILTTSMHPRAADADDLAGLVQGLGSHVPVAVHPKPAEALAEAMAWARPDDLICVTGSIFVVAQARRAWARQHPEAFAPTDWVFQDETLPQQQMA